MLSVWHELPVPNFKVLLFLCLFIDKELFSSTDFFPRVIVFSLCWKHLITLFSVNHWKWDLCSLTLWIIPLASDCFLMLQNITWNVDMSELDMIFQYWSYWWLVAELLAFLTSLLVVEHSFALAYIVLIYITLAVHVQVTLHHNCFPAFHRSFIKVTCTKLVQMQFKWVHFPDAFL